MSKWIEVFRVGCHTDSSGGSREWTEGDLDRIALGYDPSRHEAPLVIGHPRDNAPAYGWVERVKRRGNRLLVKVKETVPEFEEWVNKGLYKKRSISLYPDMTLRHVAFLGAVPPSVKGLPDFKFSEGEFVSISYDAGVERENELGVFKTLCSKLMEKFMDYEEKERFGGRADRTGGEIRKEIKQLETIHFCEKLKSKGRLLPSWEDAGIVEFIMKLDSLNLVEFAENNEKTASEWFMEFLEHLPPVICFQEAAVRAGTGDNTKENLIEDAMKKKGVGYKEAAVELAHKYPELFSNRLE